MRCAPVWRSDQAHLLAGEETLPPLIQRWPSESGPNRPLPDASVPARNQEALHREDEHDTGIRNLLNYGHTFGHAYESATHYAIRMASLSRLACLRNVYWRQMELAPKLIFQELKTALAPWHQPYEQKLNQLRSKPSSPPSSWNRKYEAGLHCIRRTAPVGWRKSGWGWSLISAISSVSYTSRQDR